MMRMSTQRIAAALLWLGALGCGTSDPPPLTRAELLDPQTCKECHADHYNEWSGSMHAYASRDPVFLAMNKRGQEEANLGDFCVKCHAPMAVHEKAISNFADLSTVPDHLQGVTCYFCHNATGVGEPHNNGNVLLADDTTMRAALGNPVNPGVHDVLRGKSPVHDSGRPDSATLCGTCHDIVTPNGTHLERTFLEYQNGIFASSDPTVFQSCQDCHMEPSANKTPAAPGFEGSLARNTHSHLWPAVDVALTPGFPNQAALRSAVERCELQQRSITYFDLIEGTPNSAWLPGSPYTFQVLIESNAGHAMPSGASNDRRMWLEVIAYDGDVERWRSGVIADGELEDKPHGAPGYDEQLCMFRSRFETATGEDAHMFWDAVGEPNEKLLPVAMSAVPGSHTGTCTYQIEKAPFAPPTKLKLRLRMRPMGMDVLDDLIASGHLDAGVKAEMPTFTVTEREATFDAKTRTWIIRDLTNSDCSEFVCMLNPASPDCMSAQR
jgi:hypothetical protein